MSEKQYDHDNEENSFNAIDEVSKGSPALKVIILISLLFPIVAYMYALGFIDIFLFHLSLYFVVGAVCYYMNKVDYNESVKISDGSTFIPNCISLQNRLILGGISIFIVGYVSVAAYYDELYLPLFFDPFYGKIITVCLILACFCAVNLLLVIIDHYDQRNNEYCYVKLRNFTKYASIALAVITVIMLVSSNNDLVCENLECERVKGYNGQTAVSYLRYCAPKEPSLDRSPKLFITVVSGNERLPQKTPLSMPVMINMYDGVIEKMFWQNNKLIVNYRWAAKLENEKPRPPKSAPATPPLDIDLIYSNIPK